MAAVHAKGRSGLGEGACACALSALCISRSFVGLFVFFPVRITSILHRFCRSQVLPYQKVVLHNKALLCVHLLRDFSESDLVLEDARGTKRRGRRKRETESERQRYTETKVDRQTDKRQTEGYGGGMC